MRAIIVGCTLLVCSLGVVLAEDFTGMITKVEIKDGKATITGTKGKKGETKDFTVTVPATIKVTKGTKKKGGDVEATDAITEGLKDDMFKNASAEKGKGVFAFFKTEKDDVTSIIVLQKKGK